MCRHSSKSAKTFCGYTRQHYIDRLQTKLRFRFYLCQATQQDIRSAVAEHGHFPSLEILAERCGFDFGHGYIGKVLRDKFLRQAQLVDKFDQRNKAATAARCQEMASKFQPQIIPATGTVPLSTPKKPQPTLAFDERGIFTWPVGKNQMVHESIALGGGNNLASAHEATEEMENEYLESLSQRFRREFRILDDQN